MATTSLDYSYNTRKTYLDDDKPRASTIRPIEIDGALIVRDVEALNRRSFLDLEFCWGRSGEDGGEERCEHR